MTRSIEKVTPEDTAILLIEFQKTWTKKGFLHRLIKNEYVSRNILQNTINLVTCARKNGVAIIHAPLILDKEDKERYKKIPSLPKLFKGFTKGTWKEEFTEGIYAETDSVATGRWSFDATEGSNLEQILEEKKITNIFFSGFTTDHCVGLTMKTLTSKGYNSVLLSDCTATRNNKLQEKIESMHKTMTGQEVIELLEAD